MSKSKENGYQENWRKPAKSIKLLVKKRTRQSNDKSANILQTRNLNTIQQDVVPARQLKRNNPFGCSPSKKSNIEKVPVDEENIKLFDALEQPVCRKTTLEESKHGIEADAIGHNINVDCNEKYTNNSDSSNEDDSNIKAKRLSGMKLPVDWSLKTRLRFTSPHPFNWCSKILGKQETKGLCNFVQHQDLTTDDYPSCFQQNIMYWIHPMLSWISLYPRLTSEMKLTTKIPNIAENQDIADALQASWCQSFRSLFNLIRCGYCDYFYLCSAQFTVLFRAALIGGVALTSAYITPTSKGIRDSLDKEGISYTLPILDASNSSTENCDSEDEGDVKDNLLKDDFTDESCWLESMGVAKETLPQLKRSKINQQRVQLRNIDHHSSSLAVVTGNNIQALFNFLLNNKTLISKTGSHAGIPPTLLAPVAFDGATLQSLTTRHGIIKQGKNLEKKYSLDITGPILPGNFSKLSQLFESSQQHQFSAVMKNLQATAPFNVLPFDGSQVQEQTNDNNVLKQPSNLGTTNLTFIKCDKALYSWETS